MSAAGARPVQGPLARLAEAHGVALEYYDQSGQRHVISRSSVIAVLRSLGVRAATSDEVRTALREADSHDWGLMLPPVVVCGQDRGAEFWVNTPTGEAAEVSVAFESGSASAPLEPLDRPRRSRRIEGASVRRSWFEIPAGLPLGWHEVRAVSPSRTGSCALVVTPTRPDSELPGRLWGVMAQIYALRSSRSWGIGDLADLRELTAWTGRSLGAGFCLVNPLHAGRVVPPIVNSPYLPSSRRFVDPLYLRVEDIVEYGLLPDEDRVAAQAEAAKWAVVDRSSELLDRQKCWESKSRALESVYRVPMGPGRQAQFEAYVASQGDGLRLFATWCALTEEYGPVWRQWPLALRDPYSRDVALEADRLSGRVGFYCWLQWQADQQLAAVEQAAEGVGMPIGVIHDLAVGVHVDSADSWYLGDVFAEGVHVGAPPDAYNQLGQDWTQPPWHPRRLAEQAFVPYRDLLRTMLRNAGGIRVDHILGLFRQWWVPQGCPPTEGTYVSMDHEALIGILVLEAHRAGAVVIGEDLGTVADWIRDYLDERGILGTGILWFERDRTGMIVPPESWRARTLTSVTVHDLPPTAGYVRGDHVRLRDELGLLTRPLAEEERAHEAEIALWREMLTDRGLLDSIDASPAETVVALHRLAAASPAMLLGVSLPDLTGDRRAQNQPGTDTEYPNWRVPLCDERGHAVLLEDLSKLPLLDPVVSAVRGY
ncbi:MAG: 4-alpha-glucanotransferase [Candidatus Nanopelagicales bacterium]|nr:4-alpha-glucanotransferase [Candidatus Nanopelagicales bacterium]MDZ4250546.1 4-alpha-glucanotransferase [Candidatus Nanopelagicales bacterium]